MGEVVWISSKEKMKDIPSIPNTARHSDRSYNLAKIVRKRKSMCQLIGGVSGTRVNEPFDVMNIEVSENSNFCIWKPLEKTINFV